MPLPPLRAAPPASSPVPAPSSSSTSATPDPELPLLRAAPDAGFEEPVAMLFACHDRTRQRLDLLGRLDAHLAAAGADAAARDAARDLLRFFDVAAAHHHEDEERHLLPRLERMGQGALAARLHADHATMRAGWALIRDELRRVAESGDDLADDRAARSARWQAFTATYRAHIVVEEGEAFPRLEATLDEIERQRMGGEMARRRGVSRGDA
jgi:hemerythrin-like domain-containing protein